MSNIKVLPIKELKDKHSLDVFIETGCSGGDGVAMGLRSGFASIFSCDICYDEYLRSQERFKENRGVCILYSKSKVFLFSFLPKMRGRKILFWLDAHLPKEDNRYPSEDIFPLYEELQTISTFVEKCVILIDDIDMLCWEHKKKPINIQEDKIRYILIDEIKGLFPDYNYSFLDNGKVLLMEPKEW